MQSDTTFFTVCLFAGALIGLAMRYLDKPEDREGWYRQLTKIAIEYILPIHIFGTALKATASSNVDFAFWLLVGGLDRGSIPDRTQPYPRQHQQSDDQDAVDAGAHG